MIVKINPPTRTFSETVTYLLHDKAQGGAARPATSDRVAWIATRNCRHANGFAAAAEMAHTANHAQELKLAAGLKASGRPLLTPAKHVSLSWSAAEQPTRNEMAATADSFLAHMGWSDHQVLIVAHSDTAHPHVHLLINRVHPVRGTALNDRHDFTRAAQWAKPFNPAPAPAPARPHRWPRQWAKKRIRTPEQRAAWHANRLEQRRRQRDLALGRSQTSLLVHAAVRAGHFDQAKTLARHGHSRRRLRSRRSLAIEQPQWSIAQFVTSAPPSREGDVSERATAWSSLAQDFRYLWAELARTTPHGLRAAAAELLHRQHEARSQALKAAFKANDAAHRLRWQNYQEQRDQIHIATRAPPRVSPRWPVTRYPTAGP